MGESMSSEQRVAIVTGASSGIGKAAAVALAVAGFQVVGTSRKTDGLEAPPGVVMLDLDVTSDASVAALVERVIQTYGRIDVVVNNAGHGAAGGGEESSMATDQSVFDTNVFGVLRMTKAVLPWMRAQGSGRIINISSVLGFLPAPFMAVYSASKHALEGLSESLDHELRQHGVRVLLVQPGFTRTGFADHRGEPEAPLPAYDEQRAVAYQLISEGVERGDDPETISRVIVAAATDRDPRLRYPAGSGVGRLWTLRRLLPARAFDKQIRKFNRLAA
jgi:NAD(P)-dependent dehydrogenase (short-subunit alcohol dehydrogenase family)